MQRGNEIVVAVLRLVVDRRPPLDNVLQFDTVESLAFACCTPYFFGKRECRSAISVSHADQSRARLGIEREWPVLDGFGTLEQVFDRFSVKRPEYEHARPRQ